MASANKTVAKLDKTLCYVKAESCDVMRERDIPSVFKEPGRISQQEDKKEVWLLK